MHKEDRYGSLALPSSFQCRFWARGRCWENASRWILSLRGSAEQSTPRLSPIVACASAVVMAVPRNLATEQYPPEFHLRVGAVQGDRWSPDSDVAVDNMSRNRACRWSPNWAMTSTGLVIAVYKPPRSPTRSPAHYSPFYSLHHFTSHYTQWVGSQIGRAHV